MERPKIYLGDLFWLAIACALALGWWVERGCWQAKWQTDMEAMETIIKQQEAALGEAGGATTAFENARRANLAKRASGQN